MTEAWEIYLEEKLIEEGPLQTRIKELGAQISVDYKDKNLLLLCILKGGILFLTDLMRYITIPHEIDFLAVSSYDKEIRESTGVVRIVKDLDEPIDGRHVLIVEDIIDTGFTTNFISRTLLLHEPASLNICTLLNRTRRRIIGVDPTYIGFEVPDQYIVGYGLDFKERYRNLPYIVKFEPNQTRQD